jgi:3-oxoacyl-[acyl-carrier protein] reductase
LKPSPGAIRVIRSATVPNRLTLPSQYYDNLFRVLISTGPGGTSRSAPGVYGPGGNVVLEGKNAIVTGSSRGIGKAIALDMASNGANVVVNCLSRVDLAGEVAGEIESMGTGALVVQSDVSSEEGARRLVDACVERFGGVDALINNAGTMRREPLESTGEGMLKEVMAIDLLSCFYTSRFAADDMRRRHAGGAIINISSIIGTIGMPGATAYAAAKGGLNGLTVCMARELARYRIRVNGVAPGYVETEMIGDWPREHFEKVMPRIPMRRFAEPREIAEVVSFLAGKGTYITGQTVVVDGGIMVD